MTSQTMSKLVPKTESDLINVDSWKKVFDSLDIVTCFWLLFWRIYYFMHSSCNVVYWISIQCFA